MRVRYTVVPSVTRDPQTSDTITTTDPKTGAKVLYNIPKARQATRASCAAAVSRLMQGARVVVNIYGVHQNSDLWPEPTKVSCAAQPCLCDHAQRTAPFPHSHLAFVRIRLMLTYYRNFCSLTPIALPPSSLKRSKNFSETRLLAAPPHLTLAQIFAVFVRASLVLRTVARDS